MKLRNKIAFIFLALLIAIQFYPCKKPEIIINNPDTLGKNETIPDDIFIKLKAACYDCHSNESQFPWYAHLAPIKWIINNHIIDGRKDLNFSIWNSYDIDEKSDLLDDISIVIEEEEMPLKGYLFLHSEAKLTDEEKAAIITWSNELLESLYD